jgi:hypothetical protein
MITLKNKTTSKVINFIKKLDIGYSSVILYSIVAVALAIGFRTDYDKSWYAILMIVPLCIFFATMIGKGIDSLERLGSSVCPSVIHFLVVAFLAIDVSMKFSYISIMLTSVFLAGFTFYITLHFLVYTYLDRQTKIQFFKNIILITMLNIGLLSYS